MRPDPDHVRIVTLNLWHTPIEVERRLDAAAAEIVERLPDVLCLQEVGLARSGTSHAHGLAARTGMRLAALSEPVPRGADQVRSGLAILTRLPVDSDHVVDLPAGGQDEPVDRALVVELTTPAGRPLVVATTHLAWGGRREAHRLRQARLLDEYLSGLSAVSAPEAVTVLTGDLNTLPESDTMRYLTGLGVVEGSSTLWVDAWAHVGTGPGYTSGPDNPWAAHAAAEVGIVAPEHLPSRRIDYVLVRDWVHGRPGQPIRARRGFAHGDGDVVHASGVAASDHWGVEVDLWDPRR